MRRRKRNRFIEIATAVVFGGLYRHYAFDLLHLDGFDLRAAPLVERKRVLAGLLQEAGDIGPLFLSDHFEDDAATLFDKSCEMGLEGIVSKLRNAPYKSGRTENWIKVK